MQYFYAIIWFIVGLILIFAASRESKIFYFAGAFFLFLGGWWLADALVEQDLFAGAWGWTLKGIALVALAAFGAAYFRERRKSVQGAGEKKEDPKK